MSTPIQTQTYRKLIDHGEIKLVEKWSLLLPRPRVDELDIMTKSIMKHGLKQPVIVNQNLELVDGYTRYRICKRTQTPIWYEIKQFADDNETRQYSLISNAMRRHLKPLDRVRIFRELYEEERREAKERQRERGRLSQYNFKATENNPQKYGRSIVKFAKHIGLAPPTAKKALVVLDNAKRKEIDLIDKGVKTIGGVYQEIMIKKRRLDENKFQVKIIVVAPYKQGISNKIIKKDITPRLYDAMMDYLRRI